MKNKKKKYVIQIKTEKNIYFSNINKQQKYIYRNSSLKVLHDKHSLNKFHMAHVTNRTMKINLKKSTK